MTDSVFVRDMRRRSARMGWLMIGAASLAMVAAAEAPAQPVVVKTYAINIAAKPLPEAVAELSTKTGLQVLYTGDQAFQRTSTAVNGSFAPEQALRLMLQGTGISYRFVRRNAVTLEAPASTVAAGAAPAGAIPLDTINVQGADQSPYGPGVGYVATRSVTGTKTDTPIIEIPQSISVVTRDQMDDQGAQTVPQALRYTAGAFVEQNGADNRYDYLNARGFRLSQYMDGLRLLYGDFAMPQIDPYDLERIEILRGPASVLYGQVSPGGLVNFVSKRPTAEPYHEVEIQAGSYGRIQGAFDLGGPVDQNGEFLYRLTGIGFDTDTQVYHTTQSRVSISPAFTWRPSADTTLTILTNYQHDPSGGYYYQLPPQGTVLPNPNGRIPTSFFSGDPDFNKDQRTQYSIGYLFDHRFDQVWSVHQSFRYSHIDTDVNFLYNNGLQPDLSTINRRADINTEQFDALTLDNNVQAKFETGPFRHTALFGFDYQHSLDNELDRDGVAPSINFLNPIYNQAIAPPPVDLNTLQTQNQYGLYGQDQIRLDRWAFLVGGRQDWAGSNTLDYLANTATPQSERAFTWRAGAVYQFDGGIAPYASYSTSFQPTAGTGFDAAPFKPLTGEQEEVGIKYQPPGSNSFMQIAAYNLTENNVLTPDPSHINFNIQTGQIRSRGIDAEAKLDLSTDLSVIASYAYLDSIVTKANNSTQGKHPSGVPADTGSLWGNYTFHEGQLSGLSFGAGIRYVGWSYGTSIEAFKVPDYALFDAAIRYDLSNLDPGLAGFKIAINANNLFDKTYVTTCPTATSCYYGLRRTVLATLSYRW